MKVSKSHFTFFASVMEMASYRPLPQNCTRPKTLLEADPCWNEGARWGCSEAILHRSAGLPPPSGLSHGIAETLHFGNPPLCIMLVTPKGILGKLFASSPWSAA